MKIYMFRKLSSVHHQEFIHCTLINGIYRTEISQHTH